MSGKARGGGPASTSMRNVANALGIARQDMIRMTQQVQKIEDPLLYPKVNRAPIPLEMTTDLEYVARLKMELDQRFRDSQYFIETEKKKEMKRYLDKYSIVKRERLNIDMSYLPAELVWRKEDKNKPNLRSKRRKLDLEDKDISEKLSKLEEKESVGNNDEDDEKKRDDDGSDKSGIEDNENLMSDEDYQEEDNDYISNYFDNGEGYGDGGSDDNLDGEEY